MLLSKETSNHVKETMVSHNVQLNEKGGCSPYTCKLKEEDFWFKVLER